MTTTSASRRAALVALAIAVAATLGCGALRQAKSVIDTASILGDFADRLGRAENLTYTAEYRLDDGSTVQLVQQPPNSAFIGSEGRFIVTKDAMMMCADQQGKTVCQRTPNNSTGLDEQTSTSVANVVGAGFITPTLALSMVVAAAVVPGAKVTESKRTIGGQDSICADVTGVASEDQSDSESLDDFTVCLTDNGVLAAFKGVSNKGDKVSIELTSLREQADPAAFAVPAGAEVVDVPAFPAGN